MGAQSRVEYAHVDTVTLYIINELFDNDFGKKEEKVEHCRGERERKA